MRLRGGSVGVVDDVFGAFDAMLRYKSCRMGNLLRLGINLGEVIGESMKVPYSSSASGAAAELAAKNACGTAPLLGVR